MCKKYLAVLFVLTSLKCYCQKDSIQFLALGDSYTIGTSELAKNNWPNQLANTLSKKDLATKATVLADAGWTSEKLIEELDNAKLQPTFDLVSLLIGVNNQYRGMSISDFKKDLAYLLDQSIVLAKDDPSRVFVLSIPDWSVMPFANFRDKNKIAKELEKFNSVVKEEAEKRELLWIDITGMSRNALVDKTLIASDSLHPSRKMYKAWVRKISKKVVKTIKQ